MKIPPNDRTGPIKQSCQRQVSAGHRCDAEITHIDQRVKTTVFNHVPGVLSCRDVRLAVQRNVAEGIPVEESNRPFKDPNQTSQDTENGVPYGASNSTLLPSLALHNRTKVPQKLDDGNNQAAEADRAEAVGESPLGGTTRRALGEVVRAEVPRAIHPRNDSVHGVLDPLGDPVHGEGDKHYEANDLTTTTASVAITRRIAAGGLVLGIDGHQGDGEPGPKTSRNQATDEADHVDMAVLFADVNGSLEHQGREGDPFNPRPEAKGHEEAKDEEHYARAPVFSPQVENSRANSPADVEYTGHPDELLRENTRKPHVAKAENDGHDKDEDKENDGVSVETKRVRAIVDSAALDVSRRGVSVECYARDSDEAGTEEKKLAPR